jgi:hypothetical protein
MRRWLLVIAGCGGGHAVPDAGIDAVPIDAPDLSGYQVVMSVPANPLPDLDVLFVVEDGPNMLAKQQHLGAAVGALVVPAVDLHVGVVSSDLGTSAATSVPAATLGACSGTGKAGALQTTAAVSGAFLTNTNYTGTFADALDAMLQLGDAGCDFPQPFAAMSMALAAPGFVRDAGNLAVIFVGAADDCSAAAPTLFGPDDGTLGAQTDFRCFAQGVKCAPDLPSTPGMKNLCAPRMGSAYTDDVTKYVGLLNNAKDDPAHQILVASLVAPSVVSVAAGPVLSPSCTFGTETAQPAVRIQALANAMQHATSSICTDDDTSAMATLSGALKSLVGDPCVPVMLATPPDCLVDDVVGVAHTTIPACGPPTLGPCWHFVTDATLCPAAQHLELVLDRPETAAPGTVEELRCR